jgi:D-lactate dehydrogenase
MNNIMLINTSRGALINTTDIIEALKSGKVGYLGIDVYEQEEIVF